MRSYLLSLCFFLFTVFAFSLVSPVDAAGESIGDRGIPRNVLSKKCGRQLLNLFKTTSLHHPIPVWIYFTDRGGLHSVPSSDERLHTMSPRAASRRRLRASPAIDRFDLPVHSSYIERLRDHVLRFRHRSRYFNAVSAEVLVSEVTAICSYPFVERVEVVAVYKRGYVPDERMGDGGNLWLSLDDPLSSKYGESLNQLDQIQVIELLEMGYNGSGSGFGSSPVLICLMDTGFEMAHVALTHVNVLAEWDFVQGDSVTSNEEGDHPEQDRHGTVVLGTIAGYDEGHLIGPAWGADYILAKTEIIDQEIRIEEDKWVAGIEWADSAGADIVSSSLGYIDWYTPDLLDGDTPICTRAADIAASHGIVVVNAVGNEGMFGDTTLIAPADGDSVIAVGAVNRYGNIAHFSSRGPSADGRIKPELVALGQGVHTVLYNTISDYGKLNGTSLATPLVAGLCVLLLEIHPDWNPGEIREALLTTATSSDAPDNTYGYGIPRGLLASGLDAPEITEFVTLTGGFPNPFSDQTRFQLYLPRAEMVTVKVYDCRGALIRTLVDEKPLKWMWTLSWDGRNDAGRGVAGGVYFLHFQSRTFSRTVKVLRIP